MKKIREVKITNSLGRKKEVLVTLVPGRLTFYSCGPTVYNFIHIGNLRTALVSDLLFRYFKRVGYEVTYVRNYTDVDDRIIESAQKENTTAEAISKKYTLEVEKDFALSGMETPTHKTTVTTHMPEIIAMIQKIIANGHAYVALDGEVLFSISSFSSYGKLSQKNINELQAGARVEVSQKKKDPMDFTLWKPAKEGEPFWESPWGKGRPGWHIECSAMSSRWLGDQIDVHHGGEDLIFPHHENEVAQSESASQKAPFVRYWLHNALLMMSKEKMSKSLGNIVSAREVLSHYGRELTRYMLLSVHYRSVVDFSDETLDQALTGLHRIYEAKQKANGLMSQKTLLSDQRAESLWGNFVADCEKTKEEIDESLASDLNTPAAVGALFSLIREFNRILREPHAAGTPSMVLGAQALVSIMEQDIGGVLGFGLAPPHEMLKELEKLRSRKSGVRLLDDEVLEFIAQRNAARKGKDFVRADQIRKELESKGVLLKDGPQGTTWEYC